MTKVIKCQPCHHQWRYKGNNQYVATCPHCRTYVSVKKHSLIVIDNVSEPARCVQSVPTLGKKGVYDYE